MMTLVTLPVRVEHGAIYTLDGTTLPEQAHALLVLLPTATDAMFAMHEQGQNGQHERQQAFADFYKIVRGATQTIHLDELSDEALNELIHQIASRATA